MKAPLRRTLAAASLVALAACAPDAWQNVRATQFNAYLDKVTAECQPLWIGSTLYSTFYPPGGSGTGEFDQVLDLVSQLFYQRISPADFRTSMLAGWPDSRTETSADCMIRKLPVDRPKSPTGNW